MIGIIYWYSVHLRDITLAFWAAAQDNDKISDKHIFRPQKAEERWSQRKTTRLEKKAHHRRGHAQTERIQYFEMQTLRT